MNWLSRHFDEPERPEGFWFYKLPVDATAKLEVTEIGAHYANVRVIESAWGGVGQETYITYATGFIKRARRDLLAKIKLGSILHISVGTLKNRRFIVKNIVLENVT